MYELVPEAGDRLVEFTLNSRNGTLVTRTRLDRERRATYRLTFRAVPKRVGSQPGASVSVMVRVLDRNDNAPRFLFPAEGNRTLYVLTSAHAGESVGRLLAVDPDQHLNGQVRYSLRNLSDRFIVQPDTGEVRITRTASSTETEVQYLLDVVATDGGQRSTYGQMRLLLRGRPISGRGNRTGAAQSSRLLSTDFLLIVFAIVVAAIFIAATLTAAMLFVARRRRRNKQQRFEADVTNSEYAGSSSTQTTNGNTVKFYKCTSIDDQQINFEGHSFTPKVCDIYLSLFIFN